MNGPQPHIVTLDVNIYLTVARKLEPGFTDKQFMSCVSDAGQHDTDIFALFQGLMEHHIRPVVLSRYGRGSISSKQHYTKPSCL